MQTRVHAVVHGGMIEPLEPLGLPEGARIVVHCILEDDTAFWRDASSTSVARIWDNVEDDIYAELLEK